MARPTLQFALNIVVDVAPEQLDSLRRVLATVNAQTIDIMQGRAISSPLLAFERMQRIHFARLAILDAASRPRLAMSTHFDGPEGKRCSEAAARRDHIAELIEHGRAGLDAIFAHADGYPGATASPQQVRDYLLSSSRVSDASAFHCGSRGRSRNQIMREAELRRRAAEWLDERRKRGELPVNLDDLRSEMVAALGSIDDFPAQRANWPALIGAGALAVLAVPIVLPLLVPAAALLRSKEQQDIPLDPRFDDAERNHVRSIAIDENLFYQNALTNVVEVKPGLFRQTLVRGVMFAVDFLAKTFYVKGKLGEIPSIQFANWFLIDGGKRLVFVSNFDSSWESYLGDFIDQASSGLTGIWSNTCGYPRTRGLFGRGSRNGEKFKAWARHIQVATQVWYSAYPALSIVNVNDNTLIRRGLASARIRPVQWLSKLT